MKLNLNEYQLEAIKTYKYKSENRIVYPALGLASEAGEVAGKVKKILRDCDGNFDSDGFKDDILSELGDVLWYVATMAYDMEITLDEVASHNIKKLMDREQRGVISGSGDNR